MYAMFLHAYLGDQHFMASAQRFTIISFLLASLPFTFTGLANSPELRAIERRIDNVEVANKELRDVLKAHTDKGGHAVMEARMKRVEAVQTAMLTQQGETLQHIARRDGVITGFGWAFSALQAMIIILGYLGYKRATTIAVDTHKLVKK